MTKEKLDAADRSVIAIDFGGSKVAIAFFQPSGEVTHQVRIPIASGDTATSVMKEVIAQTRTLIGDLQDVVIGAVSPGIILDDRILLAPNVTGWPEVALARQLSEGLNGQPVFVGNDVKAAASAESALGNLRGCNPGLYLNLGTGIAAAMVVNGFVVQGAHGASGEIGYNSAIGNARSEAPALLEEMVGSRALVRRSLALGLPFVEPSKLFASALNRTCPTAAASLLLIEDFLDEIAAHLRHIVHLLDPARIVLGGGLVGSSEVLVPGLLARLSVKTRPKPDIAISAFGQQASLHGARLIALQGIHESAAKQ